jgi:integrase
VRAERLARRNANKMVAILHQIFEHARGHYSLQDNPAALVPKLRESYDAARYEFFTPEQVHQLATAAGSEQDAAVFVTGAFTGLRRGELVALRWRDVDFENESIRVYEGYTRNQVGIPKSRRSRTVPMVSEVAEVLRKLASREQHTGRDDLVFPGEKGQYADPSALRRRYMAARETRRPAAAPLPRPAAHVRVARDQPRLDRAGPDMDGTRRHQDHDALPASQEPRGRGANPVEGISEGS